MNQKEVLRRSPKVGRRSQWEARTGQEVLRRSRGAPRSLHLRENMVFYYCITVLPRYIKYVLKYSA